MNILKVLTTSVRQKISPALMKVKMWMNPGYVKNKFLAKIRTFFFSVLDVRPKDEHDYYGLGRWLFSKRLAFAVVLITCVLCASYICLIRPKEGTMGYKAYRYNSIALKFISDKVEILGKSGYTAYAGDVDKGVVTGTGTLYGKDGNVIYMGAFERNAYNGAGKLYGENEVLKYEGNFAENLYEGNGKEYRNSGSLLYEGEYRRGKKEGTGELYDEGGNVIYTGTFHHDEIFYPELLGISTAETAQMYTGERHVYTSNDDYCVYMKDISAVYSGQDGSDSLSEDWTVSKVYVLKPYLCFNGEKFTTIADIKRELGEPVYEGNTNLLLTDELALNLAQEEREEEILFGTAEIETERVYSDFSQILDYDKDYTVYLYVFEQDDIIYQFFCTDADADFGYYSIEK